MTEREKAFSENYQAGMRLILDGKTAEGMDYVYAAAKAAPEGWLALSNELIKDGKLEVAKERCEEILKLTKDKKLRAAAINNIGMIACQLGHLDVAESAFRDAIAEFPGIPDAYSNMALLNQWRGEAYYNDAIRQATRALYIDPWHEQAAFIRAMVYLLQGDYQRGFAEYECRWRSKNNGLTKLNCNQPEWNGHNGRHVFVYGEQGHGDSILMLRYAKLIKERGIKQSWVTQGGMSALVKTIPEIDQTINVGDPLPDFDCHIPAVSLPRIFETTLETIPSSPYLTRPADAVDYGEGFHVGICWRGSTAQTNDKHRSTNLELWRDVLAVDGVTFHSLQVDFADEALLYPKIKMYEKPKDWLETANRVAGLDLVISVDTSVVHLAGALGVDCFCALHSRPYFVFPPRFGSATPWYQSVKLFRSQRVGDWPQVFSQIANELKQRTKKTANTV